MTCAACSARVQRGAGADAGRERRERQPDDRLGDGLVRPGRVTPERLVEAIRETGYGAELPAPDGPPRSMVGRAGRGAARKRSATSGASSRVSLRRGGRDDAQHAARGTRGAECDRSADATHDAAHPPGAATGALGRPGLVRRAALDCCCSPCRSSAGPGVTSTSARGPRSGIAART